MIRKSSVNLGYANKIKLEQIKEVLVESNRVVNLYIDFFWELKDFKSTFATHKVETWLSARMQQCLGKQALEIVKSQRKKRKKSKPVFKKYVINLDQRFIDIFFDINSFDLWIKLSSLGNKIILSMPSRKHKHLNQFLQDGWTVLKSGRLRLVDDKLFFDIYFEKEVPIKSKGKTLGLDVGYKNLLATSDKKLYGAGFDEVYNKISRKKQGSKAFKKSLKHRDQLVNQTINQVDLSKIQKLIVEDLKNVKQNTKGKFRKSFNNKLQRWCYSKVLDKLAMRCEAEGLELIKINPAYTSQKCSKCGIIDEKNRKGESYRCACGNKMHADTNAAINISRMGAYSPHGQQE